MMSLTCELMFIKQFFKKLKFCEFQQMRVYCDNQTTFHIASKPMFYEKTKQKITVVLLEKS